MLELKEHKSIFLDIHEYIKCFLNSGYPKKKYRIRLKPIKKRKRSKARKRLKRRMNK